MFDDRKYSPALLEFADHSVHSHFLPTLPPSQSMAGDPRVEALLCLRRGGLRAAEASAWARLLRCVRGLPECLRVGDLPLWPWGSLPQPLAQRPPREFWADVVAHLSPEVGVLRGRPGAAAAVASVRPARAPAVGAGRPASVPPTTPCPAVQRSPRVTPNRAAFFSAVDTVPAAEALRSIRQAQTAASTKVTYAAAVPLYEGACAKNGIAAWPPSCDTLELFAGYLRVSEAFASPVTYWWAIVEESRQRRCDFRLDRDWAKRVTVGLERGLPPQEQASPLTVPLLRRMGAVVSTEVDFDTVLALVCALFTLARVGTFLSLKPGDLGTSGTWLGGR